MYTLELLDNKSEVIRYNIPHMPIKTSRSAQEEYPTLSVVNHWHTEFEFIYVERDTMHYSVNGETVKLSAGQMIFVNSGQMHFGFWEKPCDCIFHCTLVHPSLATNAATQACLEEIVHNAPPYIVLHPEISSERKLIGLLETLYQSASDFSDGSALEILGCLYQICFALWKKTRESNEVWEPDDGKRLEAMHKMVGFIQQKYASRISLQEIATAGFVCRSSCCSIFKQYLNQTPIAYLTEYRISRSVALLENPRLSMTEIALQCGFSSSSYFTETFRKAMGCTPSEYRQRKQRPGQ